MISIIYPRDDLVAADIALKVGMDIEKPAVYPVPKYPGRNDNLVFQKLRRSEAIVFIMTDPNVPLDEDTLREIKFAISNGKPLYAIVPEGASFPVDYAKINVQTIVNFITYRDTDDLADKIYREISRMRERRENENLALVLTMIIVILMALITIYAVAQE